MQTGISLSCAARSALGAGSRRNSWNGARVQASLEDGEIRDGETIVSKAGDGLQAEVILLVLSPGWTPARWHERNGSRLIRRAKRAGVKVGTILAGPCEFPAMLRRAATFDATEDRPAAFRRSNVGCLFRAY